MTIETNNRMEAALSMGGPFQIAVGVTTAPGRDAVRHLEKCCTSLIDAGFKQFTVFSEPQDDISKFVQGQPIIYRPRQFGAWVNWMHTLKDLIEANPIADAYLIVQDDVVLAKDAADAIPLLCWPSDKCSAIQLCCSSYYWRMKSGLSQMPGRAMAGAWATLLHPEWARKIHAFGMLNGWKGKHIGHEPNPVKKKAIDDFIGYASWKLGAACYILRPSIALHDSHESTLGHGPLIGVGNNRVTLDWIGSTTSALTAVRDACAT